MSIPQDPPVVVCLMGPTASGKTRTALALARRFPMEIVSVDSALVYRGMDIGTAKPGPDLRGAVPHHLIDVVEPVQAYSAARFAEEAARLIVQISGRGRIPLLAGGTMLYFKALRDGLSSLPQADVQIRKTIDTMAAESGWPSLHAALARLDPETAARLEPGDSQRIQRALEVCWLAGRPMSELLAEGRRRPPPWRMVQVALEPSDRSVLHARIASRFDEMLDLGLVDELARLRRAYVLSPALPSMRCVGYRQAWDYLEGAFGLGTLRERAVAATRQLAKRQLTWLRSTPGVERFDCLDATLDAKVTDHVAATLK